MGIAMGNISVNNMKRNFSVDLIKRTQVEEEDEEDEWEITDTVSVVDKF